MKRYLISIACISVIIINLSCSTAFAENRKLAQTGMKFLSLSLDARASALGSAVTAKEWNSSALIYNPAGMSRINSLFHASLGRVQFIADINYLYGTLAINPANGQYGVLGFTFCSVDYGDFLGTIIAKNEQGYLDTGVFKPYAFAFGIGYAKALTDKFSVGGHIRYVNQNLTGGIESFDTDQGIVSVNFQQDVLAFDFGILYKTGLKSLDFGMNIRNFAKEVKYIDESFQLPLTFEIGFTFNAFDFINIDKSVHTILLSIDAVHPRDYYEQLNMGIEYIFLDTYALRMGYTTPVDEEGMSFGAGIKQEITDFDIAIDYAYTPFGIFKDVHRFTIQFEL